MKRLLTTSNYHEFLVLPDEFPDSAVMMLLGGRHIVKQEWDDSIKGYKFVIPEYSSTRSEQKFELKVVPDLEVPRPDCQDPKDVAIQEMQERINELEAMLRRRK